MLDRGVLYKAKQNSDYRFPFLKIKDRLSEADILFGNLESMISDKGHDQGGPFSFRAPPEMMEGLIFAGFDVLSIANNHSFDWTVRALVDTKERLQAEDITPIGGGLTAYDPKVIEKEGEKIAFLGYTAVGSPGWAATETVPGVAWYTDEKMIEGIKKANELADLVVVSIHYGVEYQKEPNAEQKRISKLAIDSGADLVIGHHPHVIQPVEEYGGGIIAYSLGNFIFDQGFSEETMQGLLLEVMIKDGGIIGYEKEIIKMNQSFQPVPN